MSLQQPPVIATPAARRRSWFIKVVSIVALLAFLHVPLFLTRGVLHERQSYKAQAVNEVSSVWGRQQSLVGPVLAVPYTYRTTTSRTKVAANGQVVSVEEPARGTAVAYFLPDDLTIDAALDPELRHRGIYDVVVYTAQLQARGSVRADFVAAGIEAEEIQWGKSRLLFGVSDLQGMRSIAPLRLADGTESPFEPSELGGAMLPLAAHAGISAAAPALRFDLEAVIQGSGELLVSPVGKTTVVRTRSPWPDPAFAGARLPAARKVSPEGFEAEWRVAHFSRGFPQAWSGRTVTETDAARLMAKAAFGVRLTQRIDGYSVVERAQKYGVLFFVLVFAVFFLFEVTSDLRIHPLQYGMVGAALCLFFLGFLALTEFWTTGLAYGAAAGACTVLIALYAWSFLNTGWRTLVVLGGLASTYGYLYFVIQSQDYALIAGTVALFAVLALAMYCTRRINWYALDSAPAPTRP